MKNSSFLFARVFLYTLSSTDATRLTNEKTRVFQWDKKREHAPSRPFFFWSCERALNKRNGHLWVDPSTAGTGCCSQSVNASRRSCFEACVCSVTCRSGYHSGRHSGCLSGTERSYSHGRLVFFLHPLSSGDGLVPCTRSVLLPQLPTNKGELTNSLFPARGLPTPFAPAAREDRARVTRWPRWRPRSKPPAFRRKPLRFPSETCRDSRGCRPLSRSTRCVRALPPRLCPVCCARLHATTVGKPGMLKVVVRSVPAPSGLLPWYQVRRCLVCRS